MREAQVYRSITVGTVVIHPTEFQQVSLRKGYGNEFDDTCELVEIRVEENGEFTIYTDLPVKPWDRHPAHIPGWDRENE